MFLDIINDDYDKDIIPFIKNGIIVDTSIIKIIIDGLVSTKICGKKLKDLPDYEGLLGFFDLMKINNRWDRFFITPHIFTEICTHLRNDYSRWNNYKRIVEEVLPILKNIGEKSVEKNDIMNCIDLKNPIIEIGDISIFIIAEDFLNTVGRIAILAKDRELNRKYRDNPNVMVMDYESIMLNLL
jgi:hypothetical protein